MLGIEKSKSLLNKTAYEPLEFFSNAAKLILNSAKLCL